MYSLIVGFFFICCNVCEGFVPYTILPGLRSQNNVGLMMSDVFESDSVRRALVEKAKELDPALAKGKTTGKNH